MFKVVIIGFVLGVELIFVAAYNPYPHGEVHEVRYHQKERLEAWIDYAQHPSPPTEAAFQKELHLMHKHEDWKIYAALGLLVTLNVIGVYYFLAKFPPVKIRVVKKEDGK